MPSFSERWKYDAFRSDERPPESVAVKRLPGRGLNVATRLQEDAQGNLVEPEATITIRIRWRPDLSALARFVDPDSTLWFVNGFEEVGRRRFIDVSLSSYGLLLAGGADEFVPAPTPPDGWRLEYADDNTWAHTLVVKQFIHLFPGVLGHGAFYQIGENPGDTLATRFGFLVEIPSRGFGIDGQFTAGAIRGGFPCRINNRGRELFVAVAQGKPDGTWDASQALKAVNTVPSDNDELWPLQNPDGRRRTNTFAYLTLIEDQLNPDGISFGVEVLSIGDRITINGDIT